MKWIFIVFLILSLNASNAFGIILRDIDFALDCFNNIVEKGTPVNAVNHDGLTALMQMAREGLYDKTEILIKKGADVNLATTGYWINPRTALMFAISKSGDYTGKEHNKIIQLLLDNGADINYNDGAPLRLALSVRNIEAIDILLKNGADINIQDKNGETPLMTLLRSQDLEKHNRDRFVSLQYYLDEAIKNNTGKIETLLFFLQKKPDLTLKNQKGETAFNIAGNAQKIIQLFSNKNFQKILNNPVQSLMTAASEGDPYLMLYLLQNGMDVNARDAMGQTALMKVMANPDRASLSILLKNGADTNLKDNKGQTALMLFKCPEEDETLYELLLAETTDINAVDDNGNTALMYGAKQGYTMFVNDLLQQKASVNIQNNQGETALMLAAKGGYKETLDVLLKAGANAHLKDNTGKTAQDYVTTGKEDAAWVSDYVSAEKFLQASLSGNIDVVKELLEKGLPVNIQDKDGKTALMNAAVRGHREIIGILLENGADVNLKDKYGHTVLSKAMERGRQDLIDILFKKKIDVQSDTEQQSLLLMQAIQKGQLHVVKMSLQNGVDVNFKSTAGGVSVIVDGVEIKSEGTTPLYEAVNSGNLEITELLLQHGADVNIKGAPTGPVTLTSKGFEAPKSETPLACAKRQGKKEIVELLLRYGAKENEETLPSFEKVQATSEANTPELLLQKIAQLELQDPQINKIFKTAIIKGYQNVLETLIQKGINVNMQDADAETPLITAVKYNQPDIVTLLLQKGANVNAQNSDGQTPLIMAVQRGYTDIVLLLLKQGVDLHLQDKENKTALVYTKDDKIALLLLENGAKDLKLDDGTTLLMRFVKNNNPQAVELLLKNGADINVTDKNGKTALDYVRSRYFPIEDGKDMRKILLKNGAISYQLLKKMDKVDIKSPEAAEALMSVASGPVFALKHLLKRGVNPNLLTSRGKTALMLAGNVEIATLLIDSGAQVNLQGKNGITALMYAALQNRKEVAELLLKKGAKVDLKDNDGKTAFLWACQGKYDDIIELLLQHGADKNAKTSFLSGPDCYYRFILQKSKKSIEANSVDWQKFLEQEPELKPRLQSDILDWAAANGYKEVVVTLANNARSLNEPLIFAVEAKQTEMAALLLQKGAGVDYRENGETPLMIAVQKDDLDMVRLLLQHGADVNAKKEYSEKETPLIMAVKNNNKAIVELLLKHGARVELTDNKSKTALAWANLFKYEDIAKLLLENGAVAPVQEVVKKSIFEQKTPEEQEQAIYDMVDSAGSGSKYLLKSLTEGVPVNSQTRMGETALMRACFKESANVKLLLDRGANPNLQDLHGKTALTEAIKTRNEDIVKLLLENGADVNLQDSFGHTALMQATEGNNKKIVELLLKHGANVRIEQSLIKSATKVEFLELFFEREKELGLTRQMKNKALSSAVYEEYVPDLDKYLQAIELLIQYGADVNYVNEDKSMLVAAVTKIVRTPEDKKKQYKLVEFLLKKGANINWQDKSGETALMRCTSKEIFELLLKRGANVNLKRNWGGETILHSLVDTTKTDQRDLIKMALENGADVHIRDNNGETALMIANKHGNEEYSQVLIKYGAK